MKMEIASSSPQTRCYECGTVEVTHVCHHCGRAMCHLDHIVPTDDNGKVISVEYKDLELEDTKCGTAAFHCSYCDHIVKNPSPQMIIGGVVIALIAIFLMIRLPLVGMLGLVAGALIAYYGYRNYQEAKEDVHDERPPLPVLLRFNLNEEQDKYKSISVLEEMRGRISMDSNGSYTDTAGSVEGTLTVTGNFDESDRKRLQLYQKKYIYANEEGILFHAGFAHLCGRPNIAFTEGGDSPLAPMIALEGQVHEQPFLSATGERRYGEWRKTWKYEVPDPLHQCILPVRLVPSLMAKAARRALNLEVQWDHLSADGTSGTLESIEALEIYAPMEWGKLEGSSDKALYGTKLLANETEAVQTVSWRLPKISADDHGNRRRNFLIRFENPIRSEDVISGQITLVFEGALSGIKGIDLYYPLGGRRDEKPAKLRTRVIADFEISLNGLRYQEVRVIPDPKKHHEPDFQDTQVFEGIAPNHKTVNALTDMISNENFYVKRVIEDSPRVGDVTKRNWDIGGRCYRGVCPIDFHLRVQGEENKNGDIQTPAGTTMTTLSVQGAYANADMEADIENVWVQLNALVNQAMAQLGQGVNHVFRVTDVAEEEYRNPAPTPRISARQLELEAELEQLRRAVIADKISESLYREFKADIERQLAGLTQSQSP